ncbi:hypothetical protein BCR39DRAFT_525949 [Naematelia encephala]|uniref:Major facilitator superfamily domain-containing protein n=1 Tax=Naematelia encephala TaxID=71784 RepID=A0A1Y2B9U4_9TREE|nr:hypothetical protein BCR39DRAFT_525949 [Naematelia encephala]
MAHDHPSSGGGHLVPPHNTTRTRSPIPPYLQPTPIGTRHNSSSSINSIHSRRSHHHRPPHAQQREFIPDNGDLYVDQVGDSIAERVLIDQAEAEEENASRHQQQQQEQQQQVEEEYYDDDDDDDENGGDSDLRPQSYDNLRDGSITRRAAWRRPRPVWMYCHVLGVAMALGMGMAPKSELLISLACLSHPPQQHRASPSEFIMTQKIGIRAPSPRPASDVDQRFNTTIPLPVDSEVDDEQRINATLPLPAEGSGDVEWTPADEWFRRIQREIYEYEMHHYKIHHPTNKTVPSNAPVHPLPSATVPEGPIPMPTVAAPNDGNDDQGPVQAPPETDDNDESVNQPYNEIDPKLCKKDVKVQAAAARLTMILTLISGLLAAITTGKWGETSDRLGRTKILAVCQAGLLFSEVCFVLVATYPYLAPGGYRSLLFAPTLDGLLGGLSTITATIHAYLSDVTPDGSRATVFARLTGIMMVGFAFGPAIGSVVIKASGNIMTPFYVSIVVHATWVFLILLVLPESLSSEARVVLRKNAQLAAEANRRRDAAEREWEDETPDDDRPDPLGAESAWSRVSFSHAGHSRRRKRFVGNAKRMFRRFTMPLRPLAIFLPREREDGRPGKEWNLTWVGCALFLMSTMGPAMAIKVQFAFYAYGWTSSQLGPFMSLVGASRSLVLLVLVPTVLRYVKPYFVEQGTPSRESEADGGVSGFSTVSTSDGSVIDPSSSAITITAVESEPTVRAAPLKRSAQLDLYVARISLLFIFVAFSMMALNPSSKVFVMLSTLSTFGAAETPSVNSLALSLLPTSRESGRLFGAVSVIQAIGGSLLGPLVFGNLFAWTVGIYAPTVFALAAGIMVLAQVALASVRLPTEPKSGQEERGRSRRVKRVKSSTSRANLVSK